MTQGEVKMTSIYVIRATTDFGDDYPVTAVRTEDQAKERIKKLNSPPFDDDESIPHYYYEATTLEDQA